MDSQAVRRILITIFIHGPGNIVSSRLACSWILRLELMTTSQTLIQKKLEVRSIFFNILIPNRHHLIDDFIDAVPNILPASGSETQ
jgi:hypothetical protein